MHYATYFVDNSKYYKHQYAGTFCFLVKLINRMLTKIILIFVTKINTSTTYT